MIFLQLVFLPRVFVILAISAWFLLNSMDVRADSDGFESLPNPVEIKPFSLKDQDEQLFDLSRLQDHWSMIFIGFTTCPDVCPVTLSNLEAVRAEMGLRLSPERIPRILFFAVDPERDVPVLKSYLGYFHPEYIGITGETDQIDKLIDNLGAFYRLDKKTANDLNYNVLHTAFVSVVNPAGEIVAKLTPPFHPHKTAEYLTQLIRGVSFDD